MEHRKSESFSLLPARASQQPRHAGDHRIGGLPPLADPCNPYLHIHVASQQPQLCAGLAPHSDGSGLVPGAAAGFVDTGADSPGAARSAVILEVTRVFQCILSTGQLAITAQCIIVSFVELTSTWCIGQACFRPSSRQ